MDVQFGGGGGLPGQGGKSLLRRRGPWLRHAGCDRKVGGWVGVIRVQGEGSSSSRDARKTDCDIMPWG